MAGKRGRRGRCLAEVRTRVRIRTSLLLPPASRSRDLCCHRLLKHELRRRDLEEEEGEEVVVVVAVEEDADRDPRGSGAEDIGDELQGRLEMQGRALLLVMVRELEMRRLLRVVEGDQIPRTIWSNETTTFVFMRLHTSDYLV